MGGESERTILPVARRKLDPLVERLKKDEAIELLWEGDQVREGESRMVAGLRLITCQHFLEVELKRENIHQESRSFTPWAEDGFSSHACPMGERICRH